MKKTYNCLIVLLSTLFFSYNCYAQYGTVVRVANGPYFNQPNQFAGDGGLATDTAVRFSSPRGISIDSAGDIFIYDVNNYRIRKIDHVTGILTTIAGNGTSGFSGDGGPGALATINPTNGNNPFQLCVDAAGNCYFSDAGNNRIRRIDYVTGIITTVAGNGTSIFSGDSSLAINAGILPQAVYVDAAGNLFISGNCRIRKVNSATGIIRTIAGTGAWAQGGEGDGVAVDIPITQVSDIKGDAAGNIYFNEFNASIVRKIDTAGLMTTIAGKELQNITNSGDGGPAIAAVCSQPIGLELDTLGNIYISDGYNSIRRITKSTGLINTVAGRAAYAVHGPSTTAYYNSNADSIFMQPMYMKFDPSGNLFYTDANGMINKIIAPGSAINTLSTSDTEISAHCALPATVAFNMTGTINNLSSPTDSLDITINYGEFATNSIRNYRIPYWPTYNGFGNIDSLIGNYTYKIPGTYSPTITLYTVGGYSDITHAPSITVGKDCDTSVSFIWIGTLTDSIVSPACNLPATVRLTSQGTVTGTPTPGDSIYLAYQYYSEEDTTYYMHAVPYIFLGGGYGFYDTIYHTYTAGSYNPTIYYATSSGQAPFWVVFPNLTIPTCINNPLLSGTLYMDENLDCIHEPNEVVLAYWPYALINNTIGDTTYGWCDDSGRYSIALIDSNNYTFIANPDGYFNVNGIGDSLHVFCPASGTFTVTALAGNSYTQDFAFSCSPPAFVDMSVNGWGWGYVPGDTGIIGIWSGSPTGYICDSLYATITLTLDPLLTYLGMWDGPTPTYISGDTLSWTFATVNDLFDFDAHVKIFTATTAAFATPVCNTLYVTSSQLIDPDTTNNGYSWCEPVKSSWDPNEKQVSPQGGGAPGYIPMKTPLSYLIHFQNTGTAPARNIAVRDTINQYLDISTLQIISSSAPVAVYQDTGNVIRFQFNNINLPDSTDNLRGSTGYIAYNIGPKAGLIPGTRITNDAGIYFDYNPAVVTNTTVNTYENLGVITGPALLCVGTGVELSDTTFGGGVWSINNGNATISQTGFILGVHAGYVTVSYTVPGIGVATKIINVQPMPSAGIIAGPTNVCIDSTITLIDTVRNGTWTSSNGNAVVNNGKVYGNKAGLDTITYQVSNLCATRSISKVITVGDPALCSSGVLTVNANHGLEIFPNPASTEITIKTNGRTYNSFSITNSVGQILREQALQASLTTVNIADMAPGIYFFVFKSTDGKEVKKFVKL